MFVIAIINAMVTSPAEKVVVNKYQKGSLGIGVEREASKEWDGEQNPAALLDGTKFSYLNSEMVGVLLLLLRVGLTGNYYFAFL